MKTEALPLLLVRVAELDARLRVVEHELARGRRVVAPPPLALIHARVGDSVWSVVDLRAAIVAAGDTALASAIDACGTARQLGRLLGACVGRASDGFALQRVGNARNGALWRVSRELGRN